MNEKEIELFIQILLKLLEALKGECEDNEGNCNTCLLKKDCCLLEGIPSHWNLNLIEERIRLIIEIESRIESKDSEDEDEDLEIPF